MRHTLLALALSCAVVFTADAKQPPAPESGWRVFPDQEKPVPAVEALAWRYDADGKSEVEVWISGIALSQPVRDTLAAARAGESVAEGSIAPEEDAALNRSGRLIVSMDDGGDAYGRMLQACLPGEENAQCSDGSGLGQLVLYRIGDGRVQGEFRSHEGRQGYSARFDAPLVRDTASTPLPKDARWSTDGGEPGKVWLARQVAMAKGDVATLKQHSMPEFQSAYDDANTLVMVKNMAATVPRILSGYERGDNARLWVQDDENNGFPPQVSVVEMRRIEGVWRVAETRS